MLNAVPEDFDAQIEWICEIKSRLEDIVDERDQLRDRVDELKSEVDQSVATPAPTADSAEVEELREQIANLEAENERLRAQTDAEINEQLEDYEDFLSVDAVQEEIDIAKEEATCSPRYVKGVLAGIIAEGGPVSYDAIAERLGVSTSDVSKAASELERRKIVTKDQRDDGMYVDLNTNGIEEVRRAAAEREKTGQLIEEL